MEKISTGIVTLLLILGLVGYYFYDQSEKKAKVEHLKIVTGPLYESLVDLEIIKKVKYSPEDETKKYIESQNEDCLVSGWWRSELFFNNLNNYEEEHVDAYLVRNFKTKLLDIKSIDRNSAISNFQPPNYVYHLKSKSKELYLHIYDFSNSIKIECYDKKGKCLNVLIYNFKFEELSK